MSKGTSVIIIAILGCHMQQSVAQVTWRRSFGGYGSDVAKSVRTTAEGNYIVCGSTGSFGAGGGDIYLALLDPNGEMIWSHTYGGPGVEQGNCVRQTSDGGYIIAGLTNSYGAGGYDGYVVKTDGDGVEEWSQAFGGADWDVFHSLDVKGDSVLVGGETMSGQSGSRDPWMQKLTIDGQLLWETNDGTPEDEQLLKAKFVGASQIAACGGRTVSGNTDAWLAIYDAAGVLMWDSAYGGDSLDVARDLVATTDGAYSLLGSTRSFSQDWTEAYHIKVNNNGTLLWEWNWGQINDQEGYELIELADGSFVSAHGVRTSGAGGEDMFLLFSSSDGGFESGSTYGGSADDVAFALDTVDDGGFIVAGSTMSFGAGVKDVMIVKAGQNGQTLSEDVTSSFDPLAVAARESLKQGVLFPNPAAMVLSVRSQYTIRVLLLYSVDGREAAQAVVDADSRASLPRGLASGVYRVHGLLDDASPIDLGSVVIGL